MKIELPKEPDVDRLWTRSKTGEIAEWTRAQTDEGWTQVDYGGRMTWSQVLAVYGTVYTEHPYTEILKKYPAPWDASPSGTIRSRGGRVVMDPTIQCPPCLTGLFVHLVNEFAERISSSAATGECTADEEDEKR